MNLLCIGISHHTAPLDVRETLWFSVEEIRKFLPKLKQYGIEECVMFSTCNRTELYVISENHKLQPDDLKKLVIEEKSAAGKVLTSDLFTLSSGDAAKHLFRVSAGIDSMILGDVQILAQIKEGFNNANDIGTTGFFMNRLFQLSFRAGKRSRTETEISEGAVSVSYAAVELAEKIFDDLKNKTAFIIGAGETAELTATHLRGKEIGRLLITNRTHEKAILLAEKTNGIAIPFDQWCDALAETDIIISSVDVQQYILKPSDFKSLIRKNKHDPYFIIDLGVPRNVDPQVRELDNIFLYDLDALNSMVDDNLKHRKRELPKVEKIIDEVLSELTEWYSSLEVNPTISALTQFMENIRQEELAKNINRFEPKDRELVDLVTKRIINKIIHAPIVNLRGKEDSKLSDRMQKMSAIQKLFGLSNPEKDNEID